MKTSLFLFSIVVMISVSAYPEDARLRLPSIISDNMVLQRSVPSHIWGWGTPGSEIQVSVAGQEKAAVADSDGKWMLLLDPLAAEGPYEMTVKDGNAVLTVRNLLVGEVWLGSGQSNMEMAVNGVSNAKEEIATADYPSIRCFTVKKAISSHVQDDCEGAWEICSPANVGRFSAVMYFFARELYRSHALPIGIINSSWGGSCIQAWFPKEVLTRNPKFAWKNDVPEDQYRDLKTYERFLKETIESVAWKDTGNTGETEGWNKPELGMADWKACEMPQTIEALFGENIDGAAWVRREIEVPAEWKEKDVRAQLGPTRSGMTVYINGEKAIEALPSIDVRYADDRIPSHFFREGANLLAIRYFNHYGNGGVGPTSSSLFRLSVPNAGEITLHGKWHGKVERRLDPAKMPGHMPPPKDMPTGPFNGMIAPLVSYKLRGILWYQGESNTGDPMYNRKMEALIDSWRTSFANVEMPFYFVQLANYSQRHADPVESGWAICREAQRQTLAVPHTAMAVTIDIGDPSDIHPKNKQAVGRRLALPARSMVYGETTLEYSGPLIESAASENGQVILTFSHATGGLVARDGELKGFSISSNGTDYMWANATIENGRVILVGEEIKFVRYAWDDNPECTLYNNAGLPASPFHISIPSVRSE